jgi:hypothetical protein
MYQHTLPTNAMTFDVSQLGSADRHSLSLVVQAWSQIAAEDNEILDGGCGFNTSSGYVYIALENGVTIASCFGRSVTYIVTDFDSGEEHFLGNYETALRRCHYLNR